MAIQFIGEHAQRPYVLFVKQTPFDPSRAPAGMHTAWAYCHVPAGSTLDMTQAIEDQIERFAPGFRDLVLARSTRTAAEMETYNPKPLAEISMAACRHVRLPSRSGGLKDGFIMR
jgi:phytoene dehydrogenase-like protein